MKSLYVNGPEPSNWNDPWARLPIVDDILHCLQIAEPLTRSAYSPVTLTDNWYVLPTLRTISLKGVSETGALPFSCIDTSDILLGEPIRQVPLLVAAVVAMAANGVRLAETVGIRDASTLSNVAIAV